MEPKFKIGQKVFFMDQNELVPAEVRGVCKLEKKNVYYFDMRVNTPGNYDWTDEKYVFASKEDYIATL